MASLETLKKDWDDFAAGDALWAILTDDCKRGSKWSVGEFMETGIAEIDTVMNHRYVVNDSEDLPFADGRFSFIYSNIVLQHMPQRFSKHYLREFIRLLAPAGMLVFSVQDSFAVSKISSLFVRIRQKIRARSRLKTALGRGTRNMRMYRLPESVVRRTLASAAVLDVQFTTSMVDCLFNQSADIWLYGEAILCG